MIVLFAVLVISATVGVLVISATVGVLIGKCAEGAIAVYRRRWPERRTA